MMKTKMIYMILLFSSILFGGCVRDVIDDVPGTDEDYAADKKDVVLIRMGTNDAEVKDITSRLFNNIPSSWEIGKKTILDYDKMKDPETELNADIKNPKIYMTVILNIDDVISGKYPISLFRMLKFYKRDFYVIATLSYSGNEVTLADENGNTAIYILGSAGYATECTYKLSDQVRKYTFTYSGEYLTRIDEEINSTP